MRGEELTEPEAVTIWENCRDRGCTCDRPALVPHGLNSDGYFQVRIEHEVECSLYRPVPGDAPIPANQLPDARL